MAILFWTAIFGFYCFHTWVNFNNNKLGGNWFWFSCLISIIPVFPIMVKYSKNLLVDGLIFDLMMLLSYVLVLVLLGSGKGFSDLQWLGLVVTVIGFIIMKVC